MYAHINHDQINNAKKKKKAKEEKKKEMQSYHLKNRLFPETFNTKAPERFVIVVSYNDQEFLKKEEISGMRRRGEEGGSRA